MAKSKKSKGGVMCGASLPGSTSEPLGRVKPARRRPKGRPAWESSSSDDGNRLFEHFWGSSESSDESIDLQHVRRLRKQRLKRSCAAYPCGGDLLARIENKHEDESKNWAALPQHEAERRWLAEFRMPEDVFEELLALVQPHMQDSVPQNTKQRTYTVKEKLLVTLNFLAHCPTLRQMADNEAARLRGCAVQKTTQLGKRLNKLLKAQRQMQGSNGSVPVDESGKVTKQKKPKDYQEQLALAKTLEAQQREVKKERKKASKERRAARRAAKQAGSESGDAATTSEPDRDATATDLNGNEQPVTRKKEKPGRRAKEAAEAAAAAAAEASSSGAAQPADAEMSTSDGAAAEPSQQAAERSQGAEPAGPASEEAPRQAAGAAVDKKARKAQKRRERLEAAEGADTPDDDAAGGVAQGGAAEKPSKKSKKQKKGAHSGDIDATPAVAAGVEGEKEKKKKKNKKKKGAGPELDGSAEAAGVDAAGTPPQMAILDEPAADSATAAADAEDGAAQDEAAAATTKNSFRRVKSEEWVGKKGSMDNTYEGTFGQDGWGYKAQKVLGQVRGKDFRHEKTKKKRGSYFGGKIDSGARHSFKYDSD